MREQGKNVGRGNDFDIASPGGLRALSRGTDEPLPFARRLDRGQQHARRRGDATVELQLSDDDVMRKCFRIGCTYRSEQAQRDRKVEVRSFLGKIRRGQIDRDTLGRERKTDGGKRGMHALTAFGDRLVRQADDRETRKTCGKLDLNFDRTGFEAKIRNSGDGGRHPAPPRHNIR